MLEGLEISVINYKYLELSNDVFRIDSNYFKKEFIQEESIIKRTKNKTLKDLGVSLLSFGAYSLNNFVEYKSVGIPFIRGINMKSGRISFNDMIYIDQETNKLLWKSEVTPETVLLSMSGTIGDVAIASNNWNYPINSNQDIAKIRTNGNINPYYLYVFFLTRFGQNYLTREARGSVQQHVYLSQMELFNIPIFSTDFERNIEDLILSLDELQNLSKNRYKQAEDTLMFEVGLNTLSSDFLRKLELELKPNKTPEETMEYLEKYSNTARNSFEAAHDIFMDMLDVHPNLIEDLLERGEVEIAKLLQQGMETKMKLQEYDIQQAQKNKELLIKGYEAQTNLMDLSEARLKNFNIKKLSDSFIKTGRLDAEYYQQKYEVIENVIKKNKYERLAKIVEIEKSIEPGSNYYTEEAGLPFYRVSDYNKLGLSKPNKELSKSFVEENQNLIEKIKPKKGTILFSKDGSVGTAYLLRENLNGITSGAILHLKIKDNKKIIPEYLTLTLNSNLVKMQAERDAGGSIILHWRKEEIEQVLVPILDINKQKEIADLVEQSFKLKTESERLLDVAKKAVEIAIEEGEENAMDYIKKN